MKGVKKHFEEEASEFDDIILKLVPHYNQMIDALVSAIPFKNTDSINIIDLGCGTGYVSMNIKERFPNSKLTCLDFSENMIAQAKIRMNKYRDVNFILKDIRKFEFDKKYDAVVSSLALHHLETKKDKIKFYKKIFNALEPEGIFYNADIILGSNNTLHELYVTRWKDFMAKSLPGDEIEDTWMAKHHREDRPEVLMDQMSWLNDIGFKEIDIVWKYYNFAVYGGTKSK
jgi:tRNA (cmo5U34)-methyltransferase